MVKSNRSVKTIPARIWPQSPGDEIVISGISGTFPNAKHVNELADKLYNKVDMVEATEKRWKRINAEIPSRMGVIDDIDKFDATFFSVQAKQAHAMDPQSRMVIEKAYEAIIDAGICPRSIRDTKTGVYASCSMAETSKELVLENQIAGGLGLLGCHRGLVANRISYCLGLTGQSVYVDTACISALNTLELAFSAIRSGEINAAIVAVSNLLLHPFTSAQFVKLGALSKDGYNRSFDENAAGYARSEAVCVVYLQRARDAKTNADGFKPEGMTYPSHVKQVEVMKELYDDLQFDPRKVGFVETHGTGTKIGDPIECSTIEKVFCENRADPLLIGSIKSNIGHTEIVAGLCGVTKSILVFENELIPPNLHYKKPNPKITALIDGRMMVCDEPKCFKGEYIAVNAFGFGGTNAHVLLEKNRKNKINGGSPTDELPRLVNWSGRTEEAVNSILDALESQSLDAEYVGLLHSAQSLETPANTYRGYSVLQKNGSENAICLSRELNQVDGEQLPIIWIFSGMGSQWNKMGTSLMAFPIFRKAIQKCHDVLKPHGIHLINIITTEDPDTFELITNSFVGIAAMQIGLVDLLRSLDVTADHFIGHSVGELGCAYADGTLTAEQMILAAYFRGYGTVQSLNIEGSMAAVGLGYEQIQEILPESIDAACRNSSTSTTISGPKPDVAAFVAELESKGIFAREVNVSNVAYHSRYIEGIGKILLEKLREVIPNPVKRSDKWLSTSVPHSNWNSVECQYASAEYFTNNLLSPVLFGDTARLLPDRAIAIEIAPHGLMQAIVKKSMPSCVHIPLMKREHPDNVAYLTSALGKLYVNGCTFPVERLYPAVEFPVSRGTALISPLIKWDHSESYHVAKYDDKRAGNIEERKVEISLEEHEYIGAHIVDGRVIVPGAMYLDLIRETMALSGSKNIELKDVCLVRATNISPEQKVKFTIEINHNNGQFAITEDGENVVTGFVRRIEDASAIDAAFDDSVPDDGCTILTKDEFYKELRLRGYQYRDLFQSVQEARSDGMRGLIKWQGNWSAFVDCILQLCIITKDTRSLYLPTRVRQIRINSTKLNEMIAENEDLVATYDPRTKTMTCGGIEVCDVDARSVQRRKGGGTSVLAAYRFLPFTTEKNLKLEDGGRVVTQLVLENSAETALKIAEIDSEYVSSILSVFRSAIAEMPRAAQSQLTLHMDRNVSGKSLIIAYNCLSDDKVLKLVDEKKFFLSRQRECTTHIDTPKEFVLVARLKTNEELWLLLKRKENRIENSKDDQPRVVNISSSDLSFEWIETLKSHLNDGPVILVSQNDPHSGVIGLMNCLRCEQYGDRVRCVIIMDLSAPPFDLNHPFYAKQLERGLTMNVYRYSEWGTYRFTDLEPYTRIGAFKENVFAKIDRIGDLSSFSWNTGPYITSKNVVNVHYSALNFRDLMIASGRIPTDVYETNRLNTRCILGAEFSGILNGDRVMGFTNIGAMASQIEPIEDLTWIIPKDFSLSDGATIPVVYATVYYAFFFHRRIQAGESILIHCGAGGVGMAAIRVALAYGLEVFTTVSNDYKKNYLLKMFAQLRADNIGNSRDCSFEQMIMRRTNGRGVDFVLNSLADDKLQASVRCLAECGAFLEIGRYDIENNSPLGMAAFSKHVTFRAISAGSLFDRLKERRAMYELIEKDLRAGIIQPLPSNTFQADEIEEAFRYISSGKHIGKVLLRIREKVNDSVTVRITIKPNISCHPESVYVLVGGLGGLGLEFADWLVLRGARNLVFNSRSGVTTSYQTYRIRLWESYGCNVIITKDDVTTLHGCEKLLCESSKHGPVVGIFNFAIVLHDAVFENQTSAQFYTAFAPKPIATQFLDEASRKHCSMLEHFVAISRISSGIGNAGQTNYAMANAVMERIIEQRAADGLPAKAIEWGAIGEVGLFAKQTDNKLGEVLGGVVGQPIESCLGVMDALLTNPEPIVSSFFAAEKSGSADSGSSIKSLLSSVMKLMSIRDLNKTSKKTSLGELGMDSLMLVEMKQMLDREFNIFLSTEELRAITIADLRDMSHSMGFSE